MFDFASKVQREPCAIAPSKIENLGAQSSATTAYRPATFRKHCLSAFCLRHRFRTAETVPQMQGKSARQRRQYYGPREIIALTCGQHGHFHVTWTTGDFSGMFGGGGSPRGPVSSILDGYREFTGKFQRLWPEKSGCFPDFPPESDHFLPAGLISKQGIKFRGAGILRKEFRHRSNE